MTLSEYVKQLSKILEEHPHLSEAEVCYASDDEGNNYSNAVFDPSIRYRLESDEGYSFEHAIDEHQDPESFEMYKDELVPFILIN